MRYGWTHIRPCPICNGMSTFRDEKLTSALLHAAAEYINKESNRTSLITVTKGELRDDTFTIFVSVFPDKEAGAALDFLSRQKDGFKEYVRAHVRIHDLPRITFLPDPDMGRVEETPKQ